MTNVHTLYPPFAADADTAIELILTELVTPGLSGIAIRPIITRETGWPDTGVLVCLSRNGNEAKTLLSTLDAGVLHMAIQRTPVRSPDLILAALSHAMTEAERLLSEIHTGHRAALRHAVAA